MSAEFFLKAPYVEEDGTYQELKRVFDIHPQRDETIVNKACDLMGQYVAFCMQIVVRYRSKEDGRYKQIFTMDEKDLEGWQINLYNYGVFITEENIKDITDDVYPNIKTMLKLYFFLKENKPDLAVRAAELNPKFKGSYELLFIYLLDGNEI